MAPSKVESIVMHVFTRSRIGWRPPQSADATPRGASRPLRGPAALGALVLVAGIGFAQSAHADPPQEDNDTLGSGPAMGLDPSAPQAAALPGGMTPAFGQQSTSQQEWRFDFHGFLTAPLNAGINKRARTPGAAPGTPVARPGQSKTVLHAPPVVPDDFETFSHTGVVPTTYAQLNFSDGNSVVTGNVSILTHQANVSESFLEPASQLGINDVFLSIRPDLGQRVRLGMLVGAFTSRYGATGEYDEGRYGTPLIARINGTGEVVNARIGLGSYTLLLEQGIQGQTNKAGASIGPDLWNSFADPGEGTTFVNHLHAGLGYRSFATLGAHFISAFSEDDHATNPLAPDGHLTVLAADLRLTMGRFGHFYFAYSRTKATHARSVSRIISVLNTPGGPGLMNNYLGSENDGGDGTGTLSTFGGQYDLSLGRLVSYPVPFLPDGPDVFISVFGIETHVTSKVPRVHDVYGDGVTKLKYGGEVTYSLLPWLAISGRYDRVAPALDDNRYSFAVVSPRLIFRTGWTSTDQVVLQYSHWLDGALTTVRTGEPPQDDVSVIPDKDMFSLSASMWW